MSRVALLIYGIGDLSGGGGAERFFADFFDRYNEQAEKKHTLYYIMDKASFLNLQKVDKLHYKNRVVFFKIFSNRFKLKLEFLQIMLIIIMKRIRILHVPLYDGSYLPLLKRIDKMVSFIRPRIVINIVNCYVAQVLEDKQHPKNTAIENTYYPLFKELHADGYFCWNKSFETFVNKKRIFAYPPKLVRSITSRFSDTFKFKPEVKENIVVFASRLDDQKHADWYIEAISQLNISHPDEIKKWKFLLCGKGPMLDNLLTLAKEKKLDDILEFRVEGRMERIFNHSRIYVSCQNYDNFPSLSMAEAMAAGNAIIARNVGQTGLFVKHKKNGLLIDPDNAQGLAAALLLLLQHRELIQQMGEESISLIRDEHNVKNFIDQADNFWSELESA